MTDELPIKVTLKGGAGFEDPWVTVDAATPEDAARRVRAIRDSGLLVEVAETAGMFRAVNVAAPLTAAAPAQQGDWGTPQASAPTNVVPIQAQAAAPVQQDVVYHPEGIRCQKCQAPVIAKDVRRKSDNKVFEFWSCPNNRAKGDGHHSEFRN